MEVSVSAPRGHGPYGITTTPDGSGSIMLHWQAATLNAVFDPQTGEATILEPPTSGSPGTGASGQIRREGFGSASGTSEISASTIRRRKAGPSTSFPAIGPHAYAVYVDDKGKVWVTDFGANAILSFDPESEAFESFPSDKPDAAVRQLNGRAGEVWGAKSGTDRLVVIPATGN